MKNHLMELLSAGQVAFGAQLRFGVPAIAELFARAGFDFVSLDAEHAPQTPAGIQAQLQAVQGTACTPIVRLGRNDPDEIRLMLDMGAGGVLIPLVRTADDARRAAQACRYAPLGTRSYGPSRAHHYGFDGDYYPKSQPSLACLVIIETAEAVANIDAILAVEGLDGFVIGPADLSIALGVPLETQHPKVVQASEQVVAAARRAGKPAGVVYNPAEPELMRQQVEQGARIFLASGDEWMLHDACQKMLESAAGLRADR
jgi:2-keto-3-deoxy-L-rhamnonate aldolase RhmA